MSEELEEIVEEGIDLEELAKRYEERGFFKRLADMSSGLGKPKNSREYKIARLELQRLMAPLIALLSVVLFVVILVVVTAVTGTKKKAIEVTIATIEETETELEETPEEEPFNFRGGVDYLTALELEPHSKGFGECVLFAR